MSDCAIGEINRQHRGVTGVHDDRLSGIRDLLPYAKGVSLLDIGMNHGLIAFEFARHGASVVHGCDIYEPGVAAAREIFTESAAQSRFEVVDVASGPEALQTAFGQDYLDRYDVILFLGIYHKLKEQTSDQAIKRLISHLVARMAQYFVVRTTMIEEVGLILMECGLRKVHFSALSPIVGPAEIWRRD
jgi:2-polyprenyl-3-methyl-5-hydroxy-6-metoxy-1,4-benzoquinol methylase